MASLPSLKQICARLIIESGNVALLDNLPEDLKLFLLSVAGGSLFDDALDSLLSSNNSSKTLVLSCRPLLTSPCIARAVDRSCNVLSVLDLSKTLIRDAELAACQPLPQLRKCNLRYCVLLSDAGLIPFIRKSGRSLRDLNVSFTETSDKAVYVLCSVARDLTFLDVSGTSIKWEQWREEEGDARTCFYTNASGSDVYTVFPSGNALEFLSLSKTGITDDCLNFVTRGFPSLRIVDVSFCKKVTDLSVALIASRLPNVRTLLCSSTPLLTDAGIRLLGQTKSIRESLRSLSLSNCKLLTDASLLVILSAFPLLTSLSLTNLTSLSPAAIFLVGRHLQKLTSLCLSGLTVVHDHVLTEVGANLTALETLLMTNLPNVSTLSMFTATKLRKLTLKNTCALKDAGLIEVITHNENLETLNMSECSLCTSALFKIFPKSLSQLDIGGVAEVNDAVLLQLVTRLSQVKALALDKLPLLSSQGVARALACCSRTLTTLSLNWNAQLGDEVLTSCHFPQLVHLDCWGLDKISNASMFYLAEKSVLLESLGIPLCAAVKDDGVVKICKSCPLLSSLTLSYLDVKDETIEFMVSSLPMLENLNLTGCSALQQESLETLCRVKNLRTLYLSFCPKLLQVQLIDVVAACSKLEKLTMTNQPEWHERTERIKKSLVVVKKDLEVVV